MTSCPSPEPRLPDDEATIMAWADGYLRVNHEPCRFDHHGGCQAHGYLSLEPGERCPEGAAIEAHQRLAQDTNFAPHYFVDSCGHSHPWGIACSVGDVATGGNVPRPSPEPPPPGVVRVTLSGPIRLVPDPQSGAIHIEYEAPSVPPAAPLDVERLARALDALADEEYDLMAPEQREDRYESAEQLADAYARLGSQEGRE